MSKDKYDKMDTCKYYQYVDSFLDFCKYHQMEFSCDAPTDCPLWEECESCKKWEPKK